MNIEVVSRRDFLHSSAALLAAGPAGLAGVAQQSARRQDNCQLRMTFSGLCYLCSPQEYSTSYVLMPRAGPGTTGKYGQFVNDLHQAGLYYDLAQEDPKVTPGQFWVRVSLERWQLSLPRFTSTSNPITPPAYPTNVATLQGMLGVGPVLPKVLQTILPTTNPPNPPANVASHMWLNEGSYDQNPPMVAYQSLKGSPVTLPYKVSWISPQTTGPIQGLAVVPYPDSVLKKTQFSLPPLSPIGNSTYVDIQVLNVPGDEQPWGPPKAWPGPNYCARHYAAFYDLITDTAAQVGDPVEPIVPCYPVLLDGRAIANNRFGSPYTCMLAGGG